MDESTRLEQSQSSAQSKQGGPHFNTRLLAEPQSATGLRSRPGYVLKRPIDLVVSGLGLIVLTPLFLGIALLIKLTSTGPVFFRQQRIGLEGKLFQILKFRSMKTGSETGSRFTKTNDSRVTGIGKLLRKTSLDELPQLINIFRGEMSLIGPRPYVGFELAEASAETRRKRASVLPGVSGLSQVSGRSSLAQSTILEYDVEYVEKCSLKYDLGILYKTVQKVITCEDTN
ncbi:sugar transferase [uncultured Gimesia sp.]|uniref:sugar transferase n=1 Tax=uncultured Gimesia sp. TaxID=1678688 RepID=UPI0030D7119D|tara:strand:- start:21138 stop:21824 length:687 start_codon:yes stop_codon:yes gene_type:complete